ncbi:unnamed protein product [Arctia plantaginis]|uniref:Endonuclease-reverse transcriptase n=1 Tax=Arctia plantaginis TaxID=874455 RepID=A0A8S1BL50_ARCPL|nr:unnamed protein product [Arctia plantaginis]
MELEKQTTTITQNITDTLMRTIDDKIQPLLEENKHLKSEVQTLNRKVKYLEEMNKKNNIILHGVKETENNYAKLFNIITDILQKMNVKIEKYEINKYYRLGKKQDESKIRPILISFTSYQRKAEIMKNKAKMPPKIFLTEDFSKEKLELRKNLQQQLKEEREKGNEAYIKNNKLIVRGKPEAEKRKREISMSPRNIQKQPNSTEGNNLIAPSKMHKTDAFAYMRARSFSLAEKQTQPHKA